MSKLFAALFLLILATGVHAQSDNPKYDKALADSLGADQYGMKMYVFVILKTGSKHIDDKAKRDSIFRGHMANIGRLAKEGKLVVAGPFEKNDKQYEGIFVFNVKTVAEAKPLLSTDPAVASGLLDAEMYEWYCSAALPMFLPYHDRVGKKKF